MTKKGVNSDSNFYLVLTIIFILILFWTYPYIPENKNLLDHSEAENFITSVRITGEETELKSSDDVVTLIIPKGTLSSSNKISIKIIESNIGVKNKQSKIYKFYPSGTLFSTPIEMRIKFNPLLYGNCPESLIFFQHYDDGSLKAEIKSKVVDCENNVAIFEIDSFSFGYIGLTSDKTCIPNCPIDRCEMDDSCGGTCPECLTSDDISFENLKSVSEIDEKIKSLGQELFDLESTYENVLPSEKKILLQFMEDKAKSRKQLMLKLIEKNPESFLQNVMSSQEISKFPNEIQQYFEREISTTGKIEVLHIDDFDKQKSRFQYFIRVGNERLNFFPIGTLPPIISGTTLKVVGFRLENTIAIAVNSNTFQIIQAASTEAKGEQKTLFLLVNFLDSLDTPFTREQGEELIFNGPFQNFFRESSYDKIFFGGDVIGWLTLPRNGCADGDCRWPSIYDDNEAILSFLNSNNIDLNNYDRLVFLAYHRSMNGGFSGVGKWNVILDGISYRLSMSWIGTLSSFSMPSYWGAQPFKWTNLDYLLSHELGHALGVMHANSWECGQGNILYGEDCRHREYGNYYDVMGANSYSLHFNAFFKEVLEWFDESSKITIDKSGTYTLKPLTSGSGIRMAKIKPIGFSKSPFYVEYRLGEGFNSRLNEPNLASNQNGLFINKIIDIEGQFPYPRLLDISPESSFYEDWQGVTLNVGDNVFEDPGRGVTIGPVLNADESGITFDVKIESAECVRNFPSTLFYWPYYIDPYQGWNVVISFSLTNEDGLGCSNTEFELNINGPNDWEYKINVGEDPDQSLSTFSLEPGKNKQIGIVFNIPTNAQPGEYSVEIIVTNLNSGQKKIVGTTTVNVLEASTVSLDPSTPPASRIPTGQKDVVFTKVIFSAKDKDVSIWNIQIGSDSPNAMDNFQNLRIYDDEYLLGEIDNLKYYYGEYYGNTFYLKPPWIIPAFESKVLTILSDVSKDASGLGRLGLLFSYETPNGLPVYGNTMTFFEQTCFESDDGIDYYVKGNIFEQGFFGNDHCKKGPWNGEEYPLTGEIVEFYCGEEPNEFGIYYDSIVYNCPEGCKDDACIRNPTIELFFPNGEQDWVIDSTYKIRWNHTNLIPNFQQGINLLKNDEFVYTIQFPFKYYETSYEWTIPKTYISKSGKIETLENGNDYKIEVFAIEKNTVGSETMVSDKSNFRFTIRAPRPSECFLCGKGLFNFCDEEECLGLGDCEYDGKVCKDKTVTCKDSDKTREFPDGKNYETKGTSTDDYGRAEDSCINCRSDSSADINRDGKINILDVLIVKKDFGKTSGFNPRADVNNDGIVNILDQIFVEKNFGEDCEKELIELYCDEDQIDTNRFECSTECNDGACIPEPPRPSDCGNGIIDIKEECDDNNLINGDGCSSECKLETECPKLGDGPMCTATLERVEFELTADAPYQCPDSRPYCVDCDKKNGYEWSWLQRGTENKYTYSCNKYCASGFNTACPSKEGWIRSWDGEPSLQYTSEGYISEHIKQGDAYTKGRFGLSRECWCTKCAEGYEAKGIECVPKTELIDAQIKICSDCGIIGSYLCNQEECEGIGNCEFTDRIFPLPNLCEEISSPTCSDGIENGDETGVDCGGSCPNSCAGPGTSPTTPTNIFPSIGAKDILLTPTLQASSFSDSDGDTHLASQWQISNNEDFDQNDIVWNSGESQVLTQASVPSGKLDYNTEYFWRIRYKDSDGMWSSYSSITSFSTEQVTPTIVCGNGIVQGNEECDDNNKVNGDGCSNDCKFESTCPNEVNGPRCTAVIDSNEYENSSIKAPYQCPDSRPNCVYCKLYDGYNWAWLQQGSPNNFTYSCQLYCAAGLNTACPSSEGWIRSWNGQPSLQYRSGGYMSNHSLEGDAYTKGRFGLNTECWCTKCAPGYRSSGIECVKQVICGDGICDIKGGENIKTCPEDCGLIP